MDEPTSALDVVAQRSLMVQIKELQRELGLRGRLRHPRHVAGQPLLGPAGGHVRRARWPSSGRPARCSTTRCTRTARDCSTPSRRSAAAACRCNGIPGGPPDLAKPPARLPLPPAVPAGDGACRDRRAGALHRATARTVRCLLIRPGACERQRPRGPATSRAAAGDRRPDPALQDRRRAVARTLHAVDDVDLASAEREIVALVGESGSGKSTMARLLARVYRPTAGRSGSKAAARPSARARTCWPTAARCRWCSRTRSAR